jgi:rhomboid family GlyGly-CTERM serine protease
MRLDGARRVASLSRSRIPWGTALFLGAALAVQALPGVVTALEYRRASVAAGEWWRPVTSQLVHWSWPMAVTDLGVCLLAGILVEARSRQRLAGLLTAACLAVAASVHLLAPTIDRYRGASGIAIALSFAAAVGFLGARRRSVRALAAATLLLLAAKIAVEAWTGAAVLPWGLPEGIRLASQAHVAGAIAGILAGLPARLSRERSPSPSGRQPAIRRRRSAGASRSRSCATRSPSSGSNAP